MNLSRRQFFRALAASVVAAGVPLPLGFPAKAKPLDQTSWLWVTNGGHRYERSKPQDDQNWVRMTPEEYRQCGHRKTIEMKKWLEWQGSRSYAT